MTTYKSKLEDHIKTNYGEPVWAITLPERLGSTHMLTKILSNPKRADNRQCIVFAEVLNMTVADLLETFELGKDGLSYEEKKHHRQYDMLVKQAAHSTRA